MEGIQTEMTDTSDCGVCLNAFTGSVRKQVPCPYCQYPACLSCVKRYMLESVEDPHCMNCRRAWNRDFIDSYLSTAFRKGALKKHREDILLDREKARLPLLQPRVEARHMALESEKEISLVNKEIAKLEHEANLLRNKVAALQRRRYRLQEIAAGRLAPGTEDGTAEKKEVRQFTQKCPVADCRGFLSTQWKCGTCQTWVCHECLVPKGKDKDAPHTCDEGMKATAALIKKETKPCPKCGEGISKIDGCDQMWCITCQTPFSWTTGRQVFGVVHNPHYYQWLRGQNGGEAPRVAGDIPCGGLVGFYNLQRSFQNRSSNTAKYQREVEMIHRISAEILDQHLRNYPRLDEVPDNGDLGVEYTLKNIDIEKWKGELWKRETKREKGLDLRGPLDLFANVSSEVLRRIAQGPPDNEFLDLIRQLRTLRDYVNSEMEKIGKRYGNMTPRITELWRYDAFGSNRKGEEDRTYVERYFEINDYIMNKLNDTDKALLKNRILVIDSRYGRHGGTYIQRIHTEDEKFERYGISGTDWNYVSSDVRMVLEKLVRLTNEYYNKKDEPAVAAGGGAGAAAPSAGATVTVDA